MKVDKEEAETKYIPTTKIILSIIRMVVSSFFSATYIDEIKVLLFSVASVIAAHNQSSKDLAHREELKKELTEFFESCIELCSEQFDKERDTNSDNLLKL